MSEAKKSHTPYQPAPSYGDGLAMINGLPEATVRHNEPQTVMGTNVADKSLSRESLIGNNMGGTQSSTLFPTGAVSPTNKKCSYCHTRIPGKYFNMANGKTACNKCYNELTGV